MRRLRRPSACLTPNLWTTSTWMVTARLFTQSCRPVSIPLRQHPLMHQPYMLVLWRASMRSMDDNGASFFAQADQDGDNVLDLTWEINSSFTAQMGADWFKPGGMPVGLRSTHSSQQQLILAWLKDSYESAVSACDVNHDSKITWSEYVQCRPQSPSFPEQSALAVQGRQLSRLTDYVMNLFDVDGNGFIDLASSSDLGKPHS